MKRLVVLGIALFCMGFSGLLPAAQTVFKGYSFGATVGRDGGRSYREAMDEGRPMLHVKKGEEYSIVVRNPLPVQVAVAVSIDGLNSIDGKRTTPKGARKWIIGPHSSVTISGWQTGKDSLRKFFFTEPKDAYAKWRGKKEGKPYDRNLGVIGVAWFWNAAELDRVLHPPQPFTDNETQVRKYSKAEGAKAPAPAAASQEAGTGMGRKEQNLVREVEFNADDGMMSVRDVLKIYYEFADEPSEPMPFTDDKEDDGRFSPEMP
ncbi:MAG: hypothetical protein V4498_03580 [candidate division FCPU426 bacterium]